MEINVDIIRQLRQNGNTIYANLLLDEYRYETILQKKQALIDFKKEDRAFRDEIGLCRIQGCERKRVSGITVCEHHRKIQFKSKKRNL